MMDRTVEMIFETQPNYEVVRKIKSSWWRWGYGKGDWNELVDVYNGIRLFTFGSLPEFTVCLDYTTGYNPYGYSKFSETYIDGIFAFLVYYRGEHVMTIGFSVMENHRLLVQQVQLKKVKGNRFLYRLPKHYLEYVLDLFSHVFPRFTLYIIDGESLAKRLLADYQNAQSLHIERTTAKHQHLRAEAPRLQQLYSGCGQYRLGHKLTVNQLLYRRLTLSVKNTNVTHLG
jgi:hypothetical protein